MCMIHTRTGNWGQDRRLEFIDFRLLWEGRLNRADITTFSGYLCLRLHWTWQNIRRSHLKMLTMTATKVLHC